MSAVGEMLERKERPAYVRFERVAVEDVQASKREGRYVARDVDYALITPPYSRDVFKIKVDQWRKNLKQDVDNGRMPQEWADRYMEAYKRWSNGQEVPLHGTAIRGWGVISPAQQETLIQINVLTVEDLAAITDEGIKRIGMGAIDLKNKAIAWLAQLHDKGPITQEMAALKSENTLLKSSLESLQKQVEALMAKTQQAAYSEPAHQENAEISASDILEEMPTLIQQYEQKFGKPPHHRMKAETIAQALKE